MSHAVYHDSRWDSAREACFARDGNRCQVGRLFGGACHGRLEAHHIIPAEVCADPFDVDNLLTVCSRHHPMLESVRRHIVRKRGVHPCRHNHRYDHARRECLERRMREALV